MIKFNKQIFKLMLEANQLNNPLSPLWILRSDKIFHKGKYFLKTYVHQNETMLQELKRVVFVLNYSGKTMKLESYEFKKVESYNNVNIFGCLLELPNEYDGSDYTINISSFFLSNVERTLELSEVELINLDKFQQELAKNDFLKTQIEFYELFPTLNYKYWHCYCGKINELTSENCTNCSTSKELVTKIFDKGIDNEFLDRYLSINPYKIDSAFDKQTNIDKFVEKLSAFDISAEQLLETIEAFDYASIYVQTYPIKLDTKKSANDNFQNYVAILAKYGIDEQEIENVIKVNDIEKKINDQKLAESRSRKKKKSLIVATTLIVSISLFMYLVGFDLIKYGVAYYNYTTKNYDDSITGFKENERFLDSKNLLNDSYYLKAKMEYDSNPIESMELLSQLSIEGYKDSIQLFNEYTYLFADSKFTSKDYSDSIKYFERIRAFKDSSLKIDSAYYQLGIISFGKNEYSVAADYMALASMHSYLDSVILNKEYRYLYANELISSKSFSKAKLVLTNIIDYKDSINLSNECTYQIALAYFDNKDYANAIEQFNSIKDYKDVKAKIASSEKILYAWKFEGALQSYDFTFENGYSGLSSISKYSTIYFNGMLTGGRPDEIINLNLVWYLPDGQTSVCKNDSWGNGYRGGCYFSYDNPTYGSTGNSSIKVFNRKSGELLFTLKFMIY